MALRSVSNIVCSNDFTCHWKTSISINNKGVLSNKKKSAFLDFTKNGINNLM